MSEYNNGDQDNKFFNQATEPTENAENSLRDWAKQQSSRLSIDPFKYSCSDIGNGERFAALFCQSVRFCTTWKKWLFWSGQRWQVDERQHVANLAKIAAINVYREASSIKGESEQDVRRRKALADWGKRCEQKKTQDAMISMASSEPSLVVEAKELDRNHWVLNVNNGTIDLKTGDIKKQQQRDLITKLAPVDYDSSATCPLFLCFLEEITAGNKEIQKFLQQFFGYCLTGDTSEHVLVSCWGQGSNGKSTLLKTLIRMLGDYCTIAPPSLLMAEKFAPHPTEKTILFGKRLVACIETPEGRLDELKVKELTGGDEISARRMREDFWVFEPTHKLLLATNHRPEIRGQDFAIWRRQRLVPFTVSIPKERQDKNLHEKLWAERSGILNWAIEGCFAWQLAGKRLPNATAISESIEAWREESDVLGPFIEAHCAEENTAKEESARLYEWYKAWAESQGDRPMTKHSFGKRLSERGFSSAKGTGGKRYWLGLRIDETKHARESVSSGASENAPLTQTNDEELKKQTNHDTVSNELVAHFDHFANSTSRTFVRVSGNIQNDQNAPLAPLEAQDQPENAFDFDYRVIVAKA